jgi:cutinase
MPRALVLLLLAVLATACTTGGSERAQVPETAPSQVLAPVPDPAPTGAAPDRRAEPTACADVIVLGARGSGQPVGPGADVAAMTEALAAMIAPRTVSTEAVDYVASPIGVALADPQAFAAGVRAGAQALRGQTAALSTRCADAAIVWAGYSQGALVVRTAMEGIVPTRVDVDAVVLLADPDRAPDDPVNRGTAAGGAPGRERPVAPAWTSITWSWCLSGDPVCDDDADDLVAGLALHGTGYRELGVVEVAAAEVAELLGR